MAVVSMLGVEVDHPDDLKTELKLSVREMLALVSDEDSLARRNTRAYVKAVAHATLKDSGFPGIPGYEEEQ